MSDIDTLIGLAIDEVEGQKEIHRVSKKAQAVLGPVKKAKEPNWTAEEQAFLAGNVRQLGHERVGEILGRSAMGVKLRMVRTGIKSPTRNDLYYTAYKVAWALNHDVHAVTLWHRLGILRMERAPVTGRKIYRIRRKDLLAWAVNPNNWPYFLYTESWKVRNIRDKKIARMVALRRKRWGDDWMTIGQVAKSIGVDSTDVNRVFIKLGKYRGRKVKWRNWCFVRSDVQSAKIPFLRGKGQGHENPKWTPAAYKFLVLSLAVGMGAESTFALMGSQVMFEPQQKLASLAQYRKLAPIVEGLGVEVHRRAGEIRLYTDWRLHKERFPSLARAAGHFLAGVRLNRQDKLMIRRQLFLWGWRFAKTPEQREYVQKFKYAGAAFRQSSLLKRYETLKAWGIDPFAIHPIELSH